MTLPVTTLLDAIEVETAPSPDATVIVLHGLGDTGKGWSDVVPGLQVPRGKAIRFVFPHAPSIPVSINNGMTMPAWYDIKAANLNDRADLDGVRRSQRAVEALIEREATRGVPASRVVLAGFSQGGAIALYAGLRHAHRLAGIVALSTYLIDGASLAAEGTAVNRDVPIFMAHGLYDPVVQFAWAEAARSTLAALHYNIEWKTYPMEHSANMEEVVAVGAFLRKVLP